MYRIIQRSTVAMVCLLAVCLCTTARAATIIVDNADGSPSVAIAGAWSTSSATPGYYDTDYLHDGNAGKGSKTVTFTPTILDAGMYTVFARWTSDVSRASSVPYTINYAGGGSDTVF